MSKSEIAENRAYIKSNEKTMKLLLDRFHEMNKRVIEVGQRVESDLDQLEERMKKMDADMAKRDKGFFKKGDMKSYLIVIALLMAFATGDNMAHILKIVMTLATGV